MLLEAPRHGGQSDITFLKLNWSIGSGMEFLKLYVGQLLYGEPIFASAIIAPAMISLMRKSKSKDYHLAYGSG